MRMVYATGLTVSHCETAGKNDVDKMMPRRIYLLKKWTEYLETLAEVFSKAVQHAHQLKAPRIVIPIHTRTNTPIP
jgi:hypothetical protein